MLKAENNKANLLASLMLMPGGGTIRVPSLSFSELYSAKGGDKQDAWRAYYTCGGLPLILSFGTEQKKINYLKNLFETVYPADIVERHKTRYEREMRERLLIMASSIGASCNPTKLSNTFKSVKKAKIGSQTISRYLAYLSESFLLNRATRYDIKRSTSICCPSIISQMSDCETPSWICANKKKRISWKTSFTMNR